MSKQPIRKDSDDKAFNESLDAASAESEDPGDEYDARREDLLAMQDVYDLDAEEYDDEFDNEYREFKLCRAVITLSLDQTKAFYELIGRLLEEPGFGTNLAPLTGEFQLRDRGGSIIDVLCCIEDIVRFSIRFDKSGGVVDD